MGLPGSCSKCVGIDSARKNFSMDKIAIFLDFLKPSSQARPPKEDHACKKESPRLSWGSDLVFCVGVPPKEDTRARNKI
jgi:hypothetical protein